MRQDSFHSYRGHDITMPPVAKKAALADRKWKTAKAAEGNTRVGEKVVPAKGFARYACALDGLALAMAASSMASAAAMRSAATPARSAAAAPTRSATTVLRCVVMRCAVVLPRSAVVVMRC